MSACPHCSRPAVSTWAKRWANRASPASCAECKGLSHVIASTSSGIFAVTLFILIGSIGVAAILGSYVFVGLGLLLAVAYNHWAWKKAELWPTFPDAAAAANRASWWVTVASFFAFFLS